MIDMKKNCLSSKKPFLAFSLAAALAAPAYAADTVKVGILHSLSGTMAISETSLRDVLLFTFDEMNKAGGVKVGDKSYKIEPVDRGRRFELAALRRKSETAFGRGQGRGDVWLLDLGEPQIGVAGF